MQEYHFWEASNRLQRLFVSNVLEIFAKSINFKGYRKKIIADPTIKSYKTSNKFPHL